MKSEKPKLPGDQTGDQAQDKQVLKVRKKHVEQRIDEVIEDSFPASDPPQWNSISKENKGDLK